MSLMSPLAETPATSIDTVRDQGVHDLPRVCDCLRWRKRTASEDRAEVLAVQELGDDERQIAGDTDIVHGDDVRVIQRRGRAGLDFEPADLLARDRAAHGLDRDVAAQACVARPVDFAHPALANQGENLVRSELVTGRERHGVANDFTLDWLPQPKGRFAFERQRLAPEALSNSGRGGIGRPRSHPESAATPPGNGLSHAPPGGAGRRFDPKARPPRR